MQRVLLLVLCFMYFQPLDAVFGFLDLIFGDSFKKPRPLKCNSDFTDCRYLKDGTKGVIYIGNKLIARQGRQGPNELHFHLPEENPLSGVPGNQHYAHPQKFRDLGRRNRLSFHLPEENPLSGVPGNQHYAHPQKFRDLGRRNRLSFHLPEENPLSGVPGNQHYAHPQKFRDLGRRNRLSNLKYPTLSEESVVLEAAEPERVSVEDY